MNSFADEAKYDIANASGAQIAQAYEEKRTEAWDTIENLNIIKRIISVCKSHKQRQIVRCASFLAAKLVQANRSQNSLNRAGTTASVGSTSRLPPPSRTPSSSSTAFKKAPPPPPPLGASFHADPPPSYTPSTQRNGPISTAAAAKRPPPPPPPLKPKPKPQVQYVVALYDFAAQVSPLCL